MLEEKQREVENLTKELEEMRPQAEGISADIQVRHNSQGGSGKLQSVYSEEENE